MNFMHDLFLALSLFGNAILAVLLLRSKKTPQKKLTVDAQEVLHDLTGGGTLLQIKRLNPADYLLRSPRH